MKEWLNKLQLKLDKRKAINALRRLSVESGSIDFYSNDYLGLAQISPSVEQEFPHGSGGSRLIAGNSTIHEQLETELAEFHEGESALLFNSGFDANLALLSVLPQKGDTILYDELSHSSIRQGIRLSLAQSFKFKHNSVEELRAKLLKAKGQTFIVIESIYSMDGDMPPLLEMAQLAKEFNAVLLIDEAHSNGILGKNGEGVISYVKTAEANIIRMMGLGKALGRHGGVVIGPQVIKDYLINFAPSFIYTTALPPSEIHSIRAAYSSLKHQPELIEQLTENIVYFQQKTADIAGIIDSESPIQGIIIPGNDSVKAVAQILQEKGINIRPVLSPTVPEGEERLRICLHAFNTFEEIDLLINTLKEALSN